MILSKEWPITSSTSQINYINAYLFPIFKVTAELIGVCKLWVSVEQRVHCRLHDVKAPNLQVLIISWDSTKNYGVYASLVLVHQAFLPPSYWTTILCEIVQWTCHHIDVSCICARTYTELELSIQTPTKHTVFSAETGQSFLNDNPCDFGHSTQEEVWVG